MAKCWVHGTVQYQSVVLFLYSSKVRVIYAGNQRRMPCCRLVRGKIESRDCDLGKKLQGANEDD